MRALFLPTGRDGEFVNVVRAAAIRIAPSARTKRIAVLAVFSGHTRPIGEFDTREQAARYVRDLVARINGAGT